MLVDKVVCLGEGSRLVVKLVAQWMNDSSSLLSLPLKFGGGWPATYLIAYSPSQFCLSCIILCLVVFSRISNLYIQMTHRSTTHSTHSVLKIINLMYQNKLKLISDNNKLLLIGNMCHHSNF